TSFVKRLNKQGHLSKPPLHRRNNEQQNEVETEISHIGHPRNSRKLFLPGFPKNFSMPPLSIGQNSRLRSWAIVSIPSGTAQMPLFSLWLLLQWLDIFPWPLNEQKSSRLLDSCVIFGQQAVCSAWQISSKSRFGMSGRH